MTTLPLTLPRPPVCPLAEAKPMHFDLASGRVHFADGRVLPFTVLSDIFTPDELLALLSPLLLEHT